MRRLIGAALDSRASGKILKGLLQKSIANIEKSSGVISAIIIYTLGLVLLTTNIVRIIPEKPHHHEHTGQSLSLPLNLNS